MNEDFGITNKVELYKRLTPALNCKIRELEKNNIHSKKEDIWNFLIKVMWSKKNGLELSEMVDDILNFDNSEFVTFMQNNSKIKKSKDIKNKDKQEIELL